MIWIAPAIFAVLGGALALAWKNSGRSDAAGNALERAYLVFATLILLLLVLPVLLGWWLDSALLMASPLLLILAPVGFKAYKAMRRFMRRSRTRWNSRMPTKELRDLELLLKDGRTTTDIDLVEQALARGVSVTDQTVGRSLVLTAIKSAGANDKLKLLLKAGADPSDPQALQDAVWQSDCVFTLFAHGVNPRTVLPSGDTVLFAALDDQSLRLIEMLIDAGADPNQSDRAGWPLVVAHATGRRGYGPGNWSFVASLVEHGADPFQTGPDGKSLADIFRDTDPKLIAPESLEKLRSRLSR